MSEAEADLPDGSAWALRRTALAAGRARRRARAAASASTEWPAFAPPVALASGPLGVAQAADREIARLTAMRAKAVAEFAASRPASVDRPQGTPGAMSPQRWAARPDMLRAVSEWATPELAVALSITQEAAERLLERSLTLVGRLPGTFAALQAGALHAGHVWPLLDKVAPVADDTVRGEIEAGLLRWAAGRVTTPAQLGAKARREVLARDARAAARALATALAERQVSFHPGRVDGTGVVTVTAGLPETLALYRALGAYADALPDADDDGVVRTRGQKIVDVLMDLVLRPGQGERAPVQVTLTAVAPVATLAGGDAPAEIDGHPVPAELARAFLRALTPHLVPDRDPDPEPAEIVLLRPAPEPLPDSVDDSFNDWDPADPEASLDPGESLLPAGVLLLNDHLDIEDDDDPFDVEENDGPFVFEDDVVCDAGLLFDGTALSAPAPDRDVDPAEDPPPPDHPVRPHDPGEVSGDPPWPDSGLSDKVTDAEGGPLPGSGWWAAADRAVTDAGEALLSAQRALGHARRTVSTARRADAADQASWAAGPAGRVSAASDALAALTAADAQHRAWLAALLSATGGGGLADRPRIALTDTLTGALLSLTDLHGLRRTGSCGAPTCRRAPAACTHDLSGRPGLGPPGPTAGYRPAAELDRYLRARDRRCRFPGCRRRVPKGGELDHDVPYPDGPTSAGNLTGFCTTDHRGKHQAPGWSYAQSDEGVLTVTTPTGITTDTTPPPF